MAEQSKFAGALGKLNQARLPATARKVTETPASQLAEGSRGGKRSNPDYTATTFFVRKDTKKKATRLLEDIEAGKDLSDLVQDLLAEWVSKHSAA